MNSSKLAAWYMDSHDLTPSRCQWAVELLMIGAKPADRRSELQNLMSGYTQSDDAAELQFFREGRPQRCPTDKELDMAATLSIPYVAKAEAMEQFSYDWDSAVFRYLAMETRIVLFSFIKLMLLREPVSTDIGYKTNFCQTIRKIGQGVRKDCMMPLQYRPLPRMEQIQWLSPKEQQMTINAMENITPMILTTVTDVATATLRKWMEQTTSSQVIPIGFQELWHLWPKFLYEVERNLCTAVKGQAIAKRYVLSSVWNIWSETLAKGWPEFFEPHISPVTNTEVVILYEQPDAKPEIYGPNKPRAMMSMQYPYLWMSIPAWESPDNCHLLGLDVNAMLVSRIPRTLPHTETEHPQLTTYDDFDYEREFDQQWPMQLRQMARRISPILMEAQEIQCATFQQVDEFFEQLIHSFQEVPCSLGISPMLSQMTLNERCLALMTELNQNFEEMAKKFPVMDISHSILRRVTSGEISRGRNGICYDVYGFVLRKPYDQNALFFGDFYFGGATSATSCEEYS